MWTWQRQVLLLYYTLCLLKLSISLTLVFSSPSSPPSTPMYIDLYITFLSCSYKFYWSLPFLDVIQFPHYLFFGLSCPCHLCTYMLPSSKSINSNLLARFSHFKIFWFESFSKMKVKVKLLSCVWLFATPWTVAYQVPQSMGFSRQAYWSGLPFPSPGGSSWPRDQPGSSALQADTFTIWATREAHSLHHFI